MKPLAVDLDTRSTVLEALFGPVAIFEIQSRSQLACKCSCHSASKSKISWLLLLAQSSHLLSWSLLKTFVALAFSALSTASAEVMIPNWWKFGKQRMIAWLFATVKGISNCTWTIKNRIPQHIRHAPKKFAISDCLPNLIIVLWSYFWIIPLNPARLHQVALTLWSCVLFLRCLNSFVPQCSVWCCHLEDWMENFQRQTLNKKRCAASFIQRTSL